MTTITVLTNWTVYFNDNPTVDGGSNQIRWTGTTGTTSILDLYSALMDLWDNVTLGAGDYVSYGVPLRGITPANFVIGQIFNNEPDSWFIDPESVKHLTGGGLQTVGWTYSTGVRKGIFRVPMSSLGTIVSSDVGFTASNGAVSGVLLHVDTNNNDLYIRPTDSSATHDWSSISSGTVSVNGNSGTQGAAGVTGDNIWANIFTLGTKEANTQLYVYQDQTLINNSEDSGGGLWWGTGQLDILVQTTQEDVLLDNGFLTVYAREPGDLYDNFVVDASHAGRTPVPIATQTDFNNETVGVIAANGITVNFNGPYSVDVNSDSTNENYSIQIDCNNNALSYVYEYLKYITRRASTTPTLNGLTPDQYIGIGVRLDYASETGTVNIGDEVIGSVSGATGYITNKNSTDTYAILNNVQGTFIDTENVTVGANSLNNITVTNRISSKQSPLGTFAGGRFFGAPGVYLINVPTADVNNYEVIADDGVVYQEPLQVTFELTNIQTDSEIRIYNDDLTTTRNTEITGTESSESTLRSVNNIINGGTGYSVNDVLTLQGGTFTTAAQVTVTSVSGGAITGVSISNAGAGYTENPPAPISVTGGTGTGATFSGEFLGNFVYNYTYTIDINITVVIFRLASKDIRLSGLQLTNINQSIPIQQIIERNYLFGSIP